MCCRLIVTLFIQVTQTLSIIQVTDSRFKYWLTFGLLISKQLMKYKLGECLTGDGWPGVWRTRPFRQLTHCTDTTLTLKTPTHTPKSGFSNFPQHHSFSLTYATYTHIHIYANKTRARTHENIYSKDYAHIQAQRYQ